MPERGNHAECAGSIGGGESVWCHESMAGLDVTARWELLNPKDTPVPEPKNKEQSLRPPTELEGSTNPKYAIREDVVRICGRVTDCFAEKEVKEVKTANADEETRGH
jgi:hypothetical protein